MLVTRCVFIYHYYPSVPFLIVALVYGLKCLVDKDARYEKRIKIFALACILLLFYFYLRQLALVQLKLILMDLCDGFQAGTLDKRRAKDEAKSNNCFLFYSVLLLPCYL